MSQAEVLDIDSSDSDENTTTTTAAAAATTLPQPPQPSSVSPTSSTTQQIARHVRRRSQIQSTRHADMPRDVTGAVDTTSMLATPTFTAKIGWLGKVGRLNPTQRLRFFRLGEDYLSYYRNGSDSRPRGRIDLASCTALRRSLNPTAPDLSFELVTHKFFRGEQSKTPYRTYTLVSSSPHDLMSWLDALQQHPAIPASVAMNDRDVEESLNINQHLNAQQIVVSPCCYLVDVPHCRLLIILIYLFLFYCMSVWVSDFYFSSSLSLSLSLSASPKKNPVTMEISNLDFAMKKLVKHHSLVVGW